MLKYINNKMSFLLFLTAMNPALLWSICEIRSWRANTDTIAIMASAKVVINIMVIAANELEAKYEEVVWKEQQTRIVAQLLCQIAPSFFRTLSLKGAFLIHWCSTLDHSARHEPAIPGFPVLISRISSYKGWSRVYGPISSSTLACMELKMT